MVALHAPAQFFGGAGALRQRGQLHLAAGALDLALEHALFTVYPGGTGIFLILLLKLRYRFIKMLNTYVV